MDHGEIGCSFRTSRCLHDWSRLRVFPGGGTGSCRGLATLRSPLAPECLRRHTQKRLSLKSRTRSSCAPKTIGVKGGIKAHRMCGVRAILRPFLGAHRWRPCCAGGAPWIPTAFLWRRAAAWTRTSPELWRLARFDGAFCGIIDLKVQFVARRSQVLCAHTYAGPRAPPEDEGESAG